MGGRSRGCAGRPPARNRRWSWARRSRRHSPSSSSTGRPPPRACSTRPITVKRALSTLRRAVRRSRRGRDRRLHERRERPGPVGSRGDETSGPTGSARPGRPGEHEGGVSLLRTRITLECLTRTCLPPQGGARVVRFPPFAVTYQRGGRESRVLVPWGPLQVSSRIPAGESARVGIVDTAPPLEPRFDRSPETLRALFLLAARPCSASRGRARAHRAVAVVVAARRRWRRLSPLERSLLRVEAAARETTRPHAGARWTISRRAWAACRLRRSSAGRGRSPGARPHPSPRRSMLLAEQVRAA